MTTPDSSEVVIADGAPHPRRLLVFRVLAAVSGLFFLLAVVLMATAPWVLIQPGDEPHPELHRWFFTVAGAVDVIVAGCLLALVHRPRRTLLLVNVLAAGIVAAVIILPGDPGFVFILAIAYLPMVAYPFWGDVREFTSWWARLNRPLFILALFAGSALLVTAVAAVHRQIVVNDLAAQAGWWEDYGEHASVLALAGVLAASRGPGWRILATLCGSVWLYLGLIASLVLPDYQASWGRGGGLVAVLVGVGFIIAAWRGVDDQVPAH
jgi:hypothetical protein